MRNFYYDVHVFFSRFDGYSIPVKTDRPMDEEEVIEFARDNDLFTEDGDGYHVDYVEEIDEALSFIKSRKTIEIAVADAVDYVISQGLADVQE